MIIARNDEEKRSRIWRVTTIVSSVLIVVIAIYLLTKLFTSNPLEGKWEDEDGNFGITIESNGTMVVNVSEVAETGKVNVAMDYTLDKDAKTISIHVDDKELERISEESGGSYTQEILKSAVSPVVTTFDYSVENDELILTEREYGEQMIFLKK
ncbi:MAG: hypothetical protein ACI4S2_11565 [Lachnospiraceae bacterium]